MKKQCLKFLIHLSITLFISNFVAGQSNHIPQVTPVSPESASLGRYGNVALTGATGQMSYSVPIYNIKVDGNSWPIALNYNYGGLILEGKPSLSGLGWHLSSYGSITKETRGLPDGFPTGGYYTSGVKAKVDAVVTDYLDNGSFDQVPFDDLNKFLMGTWDSEVDKYTVSVGGIQFSFKITLDSNGAPIPYYLSRHNYKVDIIKDTTNNYFRMAAFVVTDDKGIKYYFDSDDTETIASDPYTHYAQDNITSWLLSEIKYINGQSILFEYDEDLNYYTYNFWANAIEQDLNNSEPGQNPTSVPVHDWASGYNDGVHKTTIHRQILNSISFPSGKIYLTDIDNSGRKLFSKLELKDYNDVLVNKFEFTYVGVRDALTKITKNNEPFYDFEYYGIDTPGYMPEFVDDEFDRPYDQDYWKFYNNANNTRAIHLPFSNELANRTSNFTAARTGALHYIKYPTGGFTEIEYEANQVKVPYEDSPGVDGFVPPFNNMLNIMVDAKQNNNDRFATVTRTFNYPVRASMFHKIRGNVKHGNSVYLTIQKINTPPGSNYNGCYSGVYTPLNLLYYPMEVQNAKSYLEEDCPYYPYPIITPKLDIDHDPDNNCVWYPGSGGVFSNAMGCVSQDEIDANDGSPIDFFITPGTYTFTIEVNHLTYDEIFAQIGMRWYDPALENGGNLPDFVNMNVGGVRVSKIVDYPDDGDFTNVKHYNYNDDEEFSTGRLNQTPFFKNSHVWNHHMTDQNNNEYNWTHTLDEYYQSGYTGLNSNHGIPVYYSKITTHNSEDLHSTEFYPNGYTVQNYSLPYEDILADTYPYVPRLQDLSKALPSTSEVIDKLNTTINSNAITYNAFRWNHINGTKIDENIEHPWSFKYYKKLVNNIDWDCDCYEVNVPLGSENDIALKGLHEIKLYKEINLKRLPQEQTSINQGVSQVQTMTYDSNLLLQSTVTHDSQGNEVKLEYDYPYEISEPQYQGMTNVNQLSVPVRQTTFINNDKISQQKTNFQAFYELGIVKGYKPKEILSAKGTETLSKDIEFTYDSNGNTIEYVRNNGESPSTAFLYGYDSTVPVAKIENSTFAQASANVSGGYANMQNLDGSSLRNALGTVQSGLPNAQATLYTYNPLIGVSSITNPKGDVIHYDYDNLNRLQYIKDKDLNVLQENKYHLRFEELKMSLTNGGSAVFEGDNVAFFSQTSGGSGNYSYKWTVSNSNINTTVTNASSTFSVSTTSNHSSSFTLTCEVTDTFTGDKVVKSNTIQVSPGVPPLVVGRIIALPGRNQNVGTNMTYSIAVSGGSGSYRYNWKKSNGQGNTNYGYLSSTITKPIISYDCTSYTMFCTVTDLGTGTTVNKTVTITVDGGCSGGNQ